MYLYNVGTTVLGRHPIPPSAIKQITIPNNINDKGMVLRLKRK